MAPAGGFENVSVRSRRHREVKDNLNGTAHPAWIEQMLESHAGVWNAVVHSTPFKHTASGSFPAETWRRVIKDFFCVVEAFPKYMGLTLAKTTWGKTPRDYLARDWLIGNIRVEALHVVWYVDWARGHGISDTDLASHRPSPEVAALHEWLWSIAYRGSLPEAIGAINYAIEGTTGEWSRLVLPAFEALYGSDPAAPQKLAWLSAHAKYDDEHPIEAMEIVKFSTRPEQQADVASAILRSLELFSLGFEACAGSDCASR